MLWPMPPMSRPFRDSVSGQRVHLAFMAVLLVVIAVFVAMDVYEKTNAPGPRYLWAAFASVLTVVVYGQSAWAQRARDVSREDGEEVVDAAGARHVVAHAGSAGFLARELPAKLTQDLKRAGLGNMSRQIHWPGWRAFVPALVLIVGLVISYWGSLPSFGICWGVFFGALVSRTYNARPASMARAYLKNRHCPACTYSLVEVPAREDGLTVCPECGGVWGVG